MKYNKPQTKVCGKSCFFGHLYLSAHGQNLSTAVFLAWRAADAALHAWDSLSLYAHEVATDAIRKSAPRIREADLYHGLAVQIAVGIAYLLNKLAAALML